MLDLSNLKDLPLKETQRLRDLLLEKKNQSKVSLIDCLKPGENLTNTFTRAQSTKLYSDVVKNEDYKTITHLCKHDLFFLLVVACKRRDVDHDWLYERCREVEKAPDGYLDLWARDHYKSTIITFGKSIQDVLIDPDVTIGIFSHTRPIAKGFLDQIKRELEQNQFLKDRFPEILYQNPSAESPKWSLDNGIIVKRDGNPKESTIEAWGLIDGQPTSKHFKILVYDDVVTRESVTTPEQIKKVTASWELSLNLSSKDGRKRFIGTRYHKKDTYQVMMDRGSVIPRIYPATDTGTMDGEPVLLTKEDLLDKRRDMGPYTFGAQMLQDPVSDKAMAFKKEWLQFYETLKNVDKWNKYIVVDPAREKKETSDYTVMEVIGLAPDENYYLLDAIRDRLNLTQRTQKLFEFHRKWKPIAVGYEHYGMQADVEHIRYVMEKENYRFRLIELGGTTPKEDRIKKMVPVYEQARFYMPKKLTFIDSEGMPKDYVQLFIDDEYLAFPVSSHDDMMDCRARILEPKLGAVFPKPVKQEEPKPEFGLIGHDQGWMG